MSSAEVAAILTSVAALIGAGGTFVKVLHELRGLRGGVDHAARSATTAARQTGEVRHEVMPNGGGSLRDSVTRIERDLGTVRSDLAGVRVDLRDERAERRSADERTEAGKHTAHARIWSAIEDLKQRPSSPPGP